MGDDGEDAANLAEQVFLQAWQAILPCLCTRTLLLSSENVTLTVQ